MNSLKSIISDYTLQIVALGSALLGITSGVVGSFAVLRKQSLLGDAVSHSALPGIAVAFLFTQTKNIEILLIGAFITGLLSTWLVQAIVNYSRIKYDSALALILSVFFGTGLVVLTYIQKIPNSNQAGLDSFIFGQASAILKRDVHFILGISIVFILIIPLFWKELKIVSFDSEFADSLGFSSKKISMLLTLLIVIAIIIGLRTVGVILMSAMLVAPGVAARQWTNKLSVMVVLAAVFGGISGVAGTIVSSSVKDLPTGPMIVIIVSFIVLISLLLSTKRGLVWKNIRKRKAQRRLINGNKLDKREVGYDSSD